MVGSPAHWAGNTAAYGALVVCTVAPAVVGVSAMSSGSRVLLEPGFALSLLFFVGINAFVAAVLGALVGAVQPASLDRVRGRIPLALLVLGQTVAGSAMGASVLGMVFLGVGWLGNWAAGSTWDVLRLILPFGAASGAWAAFAWWLPFTVATVTGGRTRGITVAAAASVPVFLLVFRLLLPFLSI